MDGQELPCPSFAMTKGGQKVYCTQGPPGHWGTCCGDRSPDEYERLRRVAMEPTGREIDAMEELGQAHDAGYIQPDVEYAETAGVLDLLPCPVCGEAATDDETAPCPDCDGSEDADHYYGTIQTVDDIFDTREEVDGR